MMNNSNKFGELKKFSLRQLRVKIKEIKAQLPLEKRYTITYSRNFTLSLSNYCINQCGYCFYNYKIPKKNSERNVILLSNEQIMSLVQKGLDNNCKEALIMSGERPDEFSEVKTELKDRKYNSYIEFVRDICIFLLDFNFLPHTNIGLLNYEEMKELKNYNASMGLMLESTNLELFEKGGVHEHSPSKLPRKRIEHIYNAGKLKIPFTTGLLLGIGEHLEDRIKDLYLIKNIHKEYGHIQEIILQNFVKKEGVPYQPKRKISMDEILKTAGIAKIIFENEIPIQVPPNLIEGFEKEFIAMGIDDFGGISPFTVDFINPESEWPQIDKLKKICEKLGYSLNERLPIYEKYINKGEFLPENIKKTIDNINLNGNN